MSSSPRDPVPLDAVEEDLLRTFTQVWTALPRLMDADLQQLGLPLGEYFVLMHLSEAPGRSLRMSEVAAATDMSLSGATRAVQRLEAAGLVRRERSHDDKRGWHAVLTDAGLDRLRECWPTHLASVRRHFFDHITDEERPVLVRALHRVAAAAPPAYLSTPRPG
jgi:DNA-binding MarR family transcriptional regulator